MKFLLDTNVCVQVLRKKGDPLVKARFAAQTPIDVALCSVVTAELRHGAAISANPSLNSTAVESLIARFTILPFDEVASHEYAIIRHDLESRGLVIGPMDTLIAAIAMANSLILVTHNTAEFSRIAGLRLEDWEVP